MKKTILAASALAAAGLAFGPSAQAAYVMSLTQSGSNVVATGSGSIDLSSLGFLGGGTGVSVVIYPSLGFIQAGPVSNPSADIYYGFTGPTNFGSGVVTDNSSGGGDTVGIVGGTNALDVPAGYVSGSALASSATWDNRTFASLGVTPGTYVWTWGSGKTADNFTLDIAVPAPGSLLLLATALIGFGAAGWARRRRA